MMLIILLIILYFLLNKVYDYFSQKEAKQSVKEAVKQNDRQLALNQAALKSKKKMLERELFAKSDMVSDIAEINHLEKELLEVNELIDRINQFEITKEK